MQHRRSHFPQYHFLSPGSLQQVFLLPGSSSPGLIDTALPSEGEKPTEESIGISLDEAKKMVQEKVDKMGITDLQFSDWSYALSE